MNNSIATQDKKFFFEVEEGSNYKVILTYDKEEIITFEQFQKLSIAIFKGQGDFVTINKRIVQKRDIRMIEPTKELTIEQKAEREKQSEVLRKIENRKDALEKLKSSFKVDYMNKKYGVDNWVDYAFSNSNKGKHVTLAEDIKEINKLFEKAYPEEAKEIENFSKGIKDADLSLYGF